MIDDDLARGGAGIGNDALIRPVRIVLSTQHIIPGLQIPPSGERATRTFENLEFYKLDCGVLLTVDRESFVLIDPEKAHAHGYVSPMHVDSPWILAHRMFYLPILEILQHHGAHYIHAGCACNGDNGILICGPSGQGKSTLTYALARSRFSYLSDDGVFLRENSRGFEVFAFPKRLKLDGHSCSYFEELSHFGHTSGEMELALRDTRIRNASKRAEAFAIIFPKRSAGKRSEIKEIANSEALIGLLGQSIPVTGVDGVEKQLDVLGELVMASRNFELEAAEDFDRMPDLIADAVLS
jgi:hypothetical protein